MGFKEVKSKVIECLNTGYVLHEQRGDIDIKNLLSTGVISIKAPVQEKSGAWDAPSKF